MCFDQPKSLQERIELANDMLPQKLLDTMPVTVDNMDNRAEVEKRQLHLSFLLSLLLIVFLSAATCLFLPSSNFSLHGLSGCESE